MYLRIPCQRFIASIITLLFYTTVTNAELIHRYSFTDGTKDSVGNIDGKLVGEGATVAEGKLVLKNEGVSRIDQTSYMEFPSSVLPARGSVTLVAWFTARDVGEFARVLDFGQVDNGEGLAFIYFTPRTFDNLSRAAISATDVGGRIFVDNRRLDDGNPHMVAIVIDGAAGKLRVFIDGKAAGVEEDLGENTLDKVRPVTNRIGRSLFDIDPGLTGSIDEFRVYDQALTAEQIAAAQQAGPDVLPPAAPATRPSGQ